MAWAGGEKGVEGWLSFDLFCLCGGGELSFNLFCLCGGGGWGGRGMEVGEDERNGKKRRWGGELREKEGK